MEEAERLNKGYQKLSQKKVKGFSYTKHIVVKTSNKNVSLL